MPIEVIGMGYLRQTHVKIMQGAFSARGLSNRALQGKNVVVARAMVYVSLNRALASVSQTGV